MKGLLKLFKGSDDNKPHASSKPRAKPLVPPPPALRPQAAGKHV